MHLHHYEIKEKLGEGAMGCVFRSVNLLTGEEVALKRVLIRGGKGAFATESSIQSRIGLMREFEILASLHHPHVINVLDYGFDEQQVPFFTMELLSDATTVVAAAAGSAPRQKIEYLLEILQALVYLHRRGVVHRDLKPSNVLVSRGNVKLVDFGVAVERDSTAAQIKMAGTFAYMAPEVLAGGGHSVVSDLYSLGVMVYQIFGNRYPFGPIDSPDLASLIETSTLQAKSPLGGTSTVAHLSKRNAWTRAALNPLDTPYWTVIEKLLASEPQQRYQSAKEVIEALSGIVGHRLPTETAATRESILSASKFVGRDAELAKLRNALESALAGLGSAWLVSGESGVGKSRLLEEIRIQAFVQGVLTIRGYAVNQGGGAYQVWQVPLRTLSWYSEPSAADSQLLRSIIPDPRHARAESATYQTVSGDQASLLKAIVNLLRNQDRPVLLIVEDLQWAGADSTAVFRFLAPLCATMRLLLIGTYREDEPVDLSRDDAGICHLQVGRLGLESIGKLSESLLGAKGKDPRIIEFLYRETAGNVFFAIEVLRSVAEATGDLDVIGDLPLPEQIVTGGIRQIVERRVARVPPEFRRILNAQAVLSNEIEPKLLEMMFPSTNISEWLVQCANAAVIELEVGQFRFCHHKIRESLLASLPKDETVLLHQQAALTLEARALAEVENRAPRLAYHFSQAHIPEKAWVYFRMAGEDAARAYAYAAARKHYECALVELARMDDSAENRRHRVDTLLLLTSVSWTAANPERLLDRLSAGRDLVESLSGDRDRPREDRLRLSRIQFWTGRAQYARNQQEEAIRSYRELLSTAREMDDQELIKFVAPFIGQAMLIQGRFGEAVPLLEQAIAPHESVGNWAEWIRAVGFFGVSLAARGDCAEGLVQGRKAEAKALEIKHPASVALSYVYLCFIHLMAGDLERARTASRAIVSAVKQSGDLLVRFLGEVYIGWSESRSGNPQTALESVDKAKATREFLGGKVLLSDWFDAAELEILVRAGKLEEVIERAPSVIQVMHAKGSVFAEGLSHRSLATAAARTARLELSDVEAHFEKSLRLLETSGANMEAARTLLAWSRVLRNRADSQTASEREARARAWLAAGDAADDSTW